MPAIDARQWVRRVYLQACLVPALDVVRLPVVSRRMNHHARDRPLRHALYVQQCGQGAMSARIACVVSASRARHRRRRGGADGSVGRYPAGDADAAAPDPCSSSTGVKPP